MWTLSGLKKLYIEHTCSIKLRPAAALSRRLCCSRVFLCVSILVLILSLFKSSLAPSIYAHTLVKYRYRAQATAKPAALSSSYDEVTEGLTLDHARQKHLRTKVYRWCTRTDDFGTRMTDKCSAWLEMFKEWQTDSLEFPAEYVCQGGMCHGLGDRYAGILSVLSYAITERKKLVLFWKDLESVMEPSCFVKEHSLRINDKKYSTLDKNEIQLQVVGPNSRDFHDDKCKRYKDMANGAKTSLNNASIEFRNIVRACNVGDVCARLQTLQKQTSELQPKFSSDMLIGCPLRLLLQPSRSFLNFEVNFVNDGETRRMSVQKILHLMATYHVIGLHLRYGDSSFGVRGDYKNIIWTMKNVKPLRCARKIKNYLLENNKVNGKEIKFLLASDSMAFRKRASKRFSKEIMMIDLEPSHLSLHQGQISNKKKKLQETFAEWLLLSAADEIILNKYENKRLSSFSVSAWSYGLNHIYYDAETCKRKTISLTGAFSDFERCRSKDIERNISQLPHNSGAN